MRPSWPAVTMRRSGRHRGVVRIAELVVERVEDGERGVETDEVEQRERTHREVAAALHRRVDVVAGGGAGLEHAHRVVEVREQQRVDDEAGAVLDLDRFLAAARANSRASAIVSSLAVSGRTISTRLIIGAGLKKWTPHTRSGRSVTIASSTTGSVDVLVARMASSLHREVELAEQLLLHVEVLDDRLEHEVAVGQRRAGRAWP